MNRNFGTRKKERNLMVFGIRAVMEAIEAGKDIESVYVQKGLAGALYQELREAAGREDIPLQAVPPEKLHHLGGKNHQGVVALISPVAFQRLDLLMPSIYERGELPLLLILDRITDVRNFGAISRSAECLGAHAIIIPFRGAAQVNADAVKTSAGALHRIPLCRERNLKNTILFLRESGLQIIACTEKANKYPSEAALSGPAALILGSEEDGVSDEYLRLSDEMVRIPMQGTIASLNVSVAAGVMLYEAVRQRSAPSAP